MKASDPKVALLRSRNTHLFSRTTVASSLTATIAAGEEIEEFEELQINQIPFPLVRGSFAKRKEMKNLKC